MKSFIEENNYFLQNVLLFTLHRNYGFSVTAWGKVVLKDGRIYSYDFSREVDAIFSLMEGSQTSFVYNDYFEDKRYVSHNSNSHLIRQETVIATLIRWFNGAGAEERFETGIDFEEIGIISDFLTIRVEYLAELLNGITEKSALFRKIKNPGESDIDIEYEQDVSYYGIVNGKVFCLGCEYLYEEYISNNINARIISMLLSSFDGVEKQRQYYRTRYSKKIDSEVSVENCRSTTLFEILETQYTINKKATDILRDDTCEEGIWEDWQ